MIADCKQVRYVLNHSTRYNERQPALVSFSKVTDELKIEDTQGSNIRRNGAEQIIRGHIHKGKYLFFTGLNPSEIQYFGFFGIIARSTGGGKVISLTLFGFYSNFCVIDLCYSNGYNLYTHHRENYLSEFIQAEQ